MTWINFLSGQLSGQGTVGRKAWDWGKSQGYSNQQLKVAIQQLDQAGVGVNKGPGQFFHQGGPMQGVAGMASPNNPLGQFQGKEGNLGLTAYNEAKFAGWKPQAIYDEIQSGRSGMFMPEGAMAQYNRDIADEQAAQDAAKWRTDLQTQVSDLTAQINKPVDPPGVGYSASSVVGKSGTRGANLKIAGRGSRSGTSRWKRGGDSSWSMATVNTGGTSGKASNSSAVNV